MKRGKITIDSDRCKGCYLCIKACPQKVITIRKTTNSTGTYPVVYNEKNEKSCIACGSCYLVCPDIAIEVYELEGDEV